MLVSETVLPTDAVVRIWAIVSPMVRVVRVTALVQKNVASVETRMKPRLAKTRQTLRTVMAMDVTCMHKFRPGVRMRTLGQIQTGYTLVWRAVLVAVVLATALQALTSKTARASSVL